jgi:hypothetical protein
MDSFSADREAIMAKLYPGRFWWDSFNRFFLKNLLLDTYHSRNTEIKLKMAERVCGLNLVERLPLLDDPIFSKLKGNMASATHRSKVLNEELESRTRDFALKTKTGDMTLFTEVDKLLIPAVLDKEVASRFVHFASSL